MPSVRNIDSPLAGRALALDDTPNELLSAAAWDIQGTLLKPGSRSTVTRVDLAGKAYVFKQYKALSLNRRLRYAFTRSRARQSWENGQAMADFGLPIVRPLAFFEESNLGIPGRSLLIMPFQEGIPLHEYEDLEKVAPALREIFRKMADHKITHGDLKATNILIDRNGSPHFIDIDASRIHSNDSSYRAARQKDEERFLRNWEDHPEGQRVFREIFN